MPRAVLVLHPWWVVLGVVALAGLEGFTGIRTGGMRAALWLHCARVVMLGPYVEVAA